MNQLIVASAGSGKTRTLIEKALAFTNGKVLITTFTNANEEEIKERIYQKCGCIPSHILVQSWWSFLLEHGARPYQGGLYEKDIGGICIVEGRSGLKIRLPKFPIYYSEEKEFEKFYFSPSSDIYYDKISKFVIRCNKNSKGNVFKRIEKCFQLILIDEIQDFSGYDLEVLKNFFAMKSEIVLVGDPRQGTYSTSNSAKHKKFRKSDIVHFFEDSSMQINLDDTSLSVNHRCVQQICDLSNSLFPDLKQTASGNTTRTNHDGIFFIKPDMVDRYLAKFQPTQLRYNRATKVNENYPAMNFGVSKGLEFERVLIYPTTEMVKWLKTPKHKLKPTAKSLLYVALTRAKQSATIIGDFEDTFDINSI